MHLQDAVVIILDVGPSMCQAAPGHSTSLEISVKAINMIIQRKVNVLVATCSRTLLSEVHGQHVDGLIKWSK